MKLTVVPDYVRSEDYYKGWAAMADLAQEVLTELIGGVTATDDGDTAAAHLIAFGQKIALQGAAERLAWLAAQGIRP